MNINTTNLRAINTQFRGLFDAAKDRTKSMYEQIAMTIPSSTRDNAYAWLGKFPQIREWIGARELQNLSATDFKIKNKSFEGTVAVDRDDIEDDNLGLYKPQIELLGEATKTYPDKLMFRLMLDGFASLCYDGQYFFDTDHPVVDKNGDTQSVSNFGGGAGTPWFLLDTSKAVRAFIWQQRQAFKYCAMDNPQDEGVFMNKQFRHGVDGRGNAGYGLWQFAYGSKQALDGTSYNDGVSAMMSVTMDGGEPLGALPNLLVVPPTLRSAALNVLKAQNLANGASNVNYGTADLLIVPWLATV